MSNRQHRGGLLTAALSMQIGKPVVVYLEGCSLAFQGIVKEVTSDSFVILTAPDGPGPVYRLDGWLIAGFATNKD